MSGQNDAFFHVLDILSSGTIPLILMSRPCSEQQQWRLDLLWSNWPVEIDCVAGHGVESEARQ